MDGIRRLFVFMCVAWICWTTPRAFGEEAGALWNDHYEAAEQHFWDAQYTQAQQQIERALQLTTGGRDDDYQRVKSQQLGALIAYHLGREDEALATMRRLVALFDERSPEDALRQGLLVDLARVHEWRKEDDLAEAVARRVLALHIAAPGSPWEHRWDALDVISNVQWGRQRFDEAEQTLLEMLEFGRVYAGPDHPWVVPAWTWLAHAREQQGKWEGAAWARRRYVRHMLRLHGRDAAQLIVPLRNLARAERELGRLGEAEQAAQRALRIARRHGPWANAATIAPLIELSHVYSERDQPHRGEQVLRQAVAAGLLNGRHELEERLATPAVLLSRSLREQYRYAAAEEFLGHVETALRPFVVDPWAMHRLTEERARVAGALGRTRESLDMQQRLITALPDDDHSGRFRVLVAMAHNHLRLQETQQAARVVEELTSLTWHFAPDDWNRRTEAVALAAMLHESSDQPDRGLKVIEAALAGLPSDDQGWLRHQRVEFLLGKGDHAAALAELQSDELWTAVYARSRLMRQARLRLLSMAHYGRGSWAEAGQAMWEAARINPDHAELPLRAWCVGARSEPDRARAESALRQWLQRPLPTPTENDWLFIRTAAAFVPGDIDAAAFADAANSDLPPGRLIRLSVRHYLEGLLAALQGRGADARAAFQACVAKSQRHTWVYEASRVELARLEAMQ